MIAIYLKKKEVKAKITRKKNRTECENKTNDDSLRAGGDKTKHSGKRLFNVHFQFRVCVFVASRLFRLFFPYIDI